MFKCEFCTLSFETKFGCSEHAAKEHTFFCKPCLKSFKKEKMYKEHLLQFHSFKCEECGVILRSRILLAAHELGHAFKCQSLRCRQSFATAAALSIHQKSHPIIKCRSCGGKFDTPAGLDEHNSLAHKISCECGETLESSGALLQHFRSAHIKFDCCTETFENCADLKLHYESVHTSTSGKSKKSLPATSRLEETVTTSEKDSSIPTEGDAPQTAILNRIPCPKCSEQLDNMDAFLEHYRFIHMFTCCDCEAVFDNTTSLEHHEASVHANPVPDSNADASLTFFDCTSSCSNPRATNEDSHPPKPDLKEAGIQTTVHPCIECGTTLDSSEDLDIHMKHSPFHGPKVLSCTECRDGSFTNQIDLLRHIESKPHKTRWVLAMI
jgi:hypothetical protein